MIGLPHGIGRQPKLHACGNSEIVCGVLKLENSCGKNRLLWLRMRLESADYEITSMVAEGAEQNN